MYEVRKDVDECYKDLANAIVLRAVDDYRRTIRCKRYLGAYAPKSEKKNLIAFFKSEWFYFLSDVSGEEMLKRLDDEYEQEQKKKRRKAVRSDEKYQRYSKSCVGSAFEEPCSKKQR